MLNTSAEKLNSTIKRRFSRRSNANGDLARACAGCVNPSVRLPMLPNSVSARLISGTRVRSLDGAFSIFLHNPLLHCAVSPGCELYVQRHNFIYPYSLKT